MKVKGISEQGFKRLSTRIISQDSELEFPVVHLNGTSQEELLNQLEGVLSSFQDLFSAMSNAAPNGRDYYIKGDQSFKIARNQYEDRVRRVREVFEEYNNIYEYLVDLD